MAMQNYVLKLAIHMPVTTLQYVTLLDNIMSSVNDIPHNSFPIRSTSYKTCQVLRTRKNHIKIKPTILSMYK